MFLKKNRETFPRKCFWKKESETQVTLFQILG